MESPIRVSHKLMLVQRLISQIDGQVSAVNRRILEIAVLFAVALSGWTLIATDEISASQTLLQSDWLLVARPFFEAITDLFLYVFYLLFAGLLVVGFVA